MDSTGGRAWARGSLIEPWVLCVLALCLACQVANATRPGEL
jgi:hypothetical protein